MRRYIDLIREAEEQQISLTDAILTVRHTYNENGVETREIGNGKCEDFADDVLELWQGKEWIHANDPEWMQVETLNFVIQEDNDVLGWDWVLLQNHWGISGPPQPYTVEQADAVARHEPTHIWITYQGRHYDAESPEGVKSLFELGFFTRWLSHCKDEPTD